MYEMLIYCLLMDGTHPSDVSAMHCSLKKGDSGEPRQEDWFNLYYVWARINLRVSIMY